VDDFQKRVQSYEEKTNRPNFPHDFLSKKPFLLFLPPSEKHKSTPFEGFAIPNASRDHPERIVNES